jgi:hypothetical protein
MAAGMRHGTFFPTIADSKKQGAACIAGKNRIPMLLLSLKPKTALAVEYVTCLATSTATL